MFSLANGNEKQNKQAISKAIDRLQGCIASVGDKAICNLNL